MKKSKRCVKVRPAKDGAKSAGEYLSATSTGRLPVPLVRADGACEERAPSEMTKPITNLSVSLDIEPRSYRQGTKFLSRRPEVVAYRKAVKALALQQIGSGERPVFSGPIKVTIMFWYHQAPTSPDLDNACKNLFDALKGILWRDDRDIWELYLGKGKDAERPRIDILATTIWPDVMLQIHGIREEKT
jgi:Holliday junction resolvase RusA-like endonuclease